VAKAITKAAKLLLRLNPGTFELSPTFFAVPRCYVDGYFPPGVLSLSEFRRIIHLCYTRNVDYGTAWAGNKDYDKLFGYINPKDFKRQEGSLISRGFIAVDSTRGTATQYSILVPPMYDSERNALVPLNPGSVFKSSKVDSFIMVPSSIVTDEVLSKRYAFGELDLNEVLLLLKFYRHNALLAFGGVDHNLFNVQNGQTFVSNSAFMDINLSRDEFQIALDGLMNRGLVSLQEVNADRFVIDNSL